MIISVIRTVILYILVTASVRIMGKRQIGELQPGELVVTILLSETAAIAMQDNNIPLINSVIPVMLLVAFEIIVSVIAMKSTRFRTATDGSAVVIIRNGKIDQYQIKRLRFTVDDILSALRQKDVFDISDIAYAVAETNGSLSVLLKAEKQAVTPDDMNIKPDGSDYLVPVIVDGSIRRDGFAESGMTDKKLALLLKKKGLEVSGIYLLSASVSGKLNIIEKE